MQVNFILSSINDYHYLKRVNEFIENGFSVKVFGFRRKGMALPTVSFPIEELGEIACKNYFDRLRLFHKAIKSIAKKKLEGLFFYSSLDIALFATHYIKSPYIYEVCDLTELTINNWFIRKFLIIENKRIVNHSKKTIITSEGFLDFWGKIDLEKISLIPNKVSLDCPQPLPQRKCFNENLIDIGFVGVIRFETILNFVEEVKNKPHINMHLFGIFSKEDEAAKKIMDVAENCENIIYHGPFKNPSDLPSIYQKLDLVLCTYPPTPGVIYAEPNKLYEAIYFRCPIIVSEGTFLGGKVKRLDVGYVIDATNSSSILKFISSFSESDYKRKVDACESIPRSNCLNDNSAFFKEIKNLC